MISFALRLMRFTVRVASWATPHVQAWKKRRDADSNEFLYQMNSHNWTESEKYFRDKIESKRLGDAERAEVLIPLARAERHLKKLREALHHCQTAAELTLQLKDGPRRLQALMELAEIHEVQGNWDAAAAAWRESCAGDEPRRSEGKKIRATCSRRLGLALMASGNNEDAQAALEAALTRSKTAFGLEHAETANGLLALGALFRNSGQHEKAQQSLREAVEVHGKASGRDSKEITEALYQLAASLEESGDIQGAIREYERVLTSHDRIIGGDPAEHAIAKVRLAALYLHVERSSAARELLIHALRILEKVGGERLLICLQALACAEEQAQRPEDAQKYQERADALSAKLAEKTAPQTTAAR